MTEKAGADLRKEVRVPFNENVTLNGALRVKAVDISENGLYLHTGRSFIIGKMVDVSFYLNYKPINVTAKVMFNQSGVGMGLRFLNLSNDEKVQIKAYIEEMTAKGIKKEETQKKKIAIVYDIASALTMHKSEFIRAGLAFVEIKCGPGVYAAIEENIPINMIVLALEMNKQEHFDVLSMLRVSNETNKLPILVITSNMKPDVLNKIRTSGANEILSRMTAAPRKLVDIINKMMGH